MRLVTNRVKGYLGSANDSVWLLGKSSHHCCSLSAKTGLHAYGSCMANQCLENA